jgi:hypothetical protein
MKAKKRPKTFDVFRWKIDPTPDWACDHIHIDGEERLYSDGEYAEEGDFIIQRPNYGISIMNEYEFHAKYEVVI